MKALLTAAVVVISIASATAQTITRSVVVPDHAEASPDLSSTLNYADAIIVGQVISQEQETHRIGDRPDPIIRHKVRVLEVAKGPSTLVVGGIIDVIQPGGTGRIGNVEVTVSDPDFPVFSKDAKYVFILRITGGAFASYSGPATVLPIVGDDRFVLPRSAEHIADLKSHRNDSVGALLSFMRSKLQRGRSGGRDEYSQAFTRQPRGTSIGDPNLNAAWSCSSDTWCSMRH